MINKKQNFSTNKTLRTILIEIFSVVFGVLLALGINQWNQNRVNRATTRIVLNNIRNELQSNRELLYRLHENNLETVKLAEEESPADTTGDRTIVPGIYLQETAWNTLITANVSPYIHYDDLYQLSNAYSAQANYKKYGLALLQGALNSAASAVAAGSHIENDHFTREFLDYFVLLTQMETQLLNAYDLALEQLGVEISPQTGVADSVHQK